MSISVGESIKKYCALQREIMEANAKIAKEKQAERKIAKECNEKLKKYLIENNATCIPVVISSAASSNAEEKSEKSPKRLYMRLKTTVRKNALSDKSIAKLLEVNPTPEELNALAKTFPTQPPTLFDVYTAWLQRRLEQINTKTTFELSASKERGVVKRKRGEEKYDDAPEPKRTFPITPEVIKSVQNLYKSQTKQKQWKEDLKKTTADKVVLKKKYEPIIESFLLRKDSTIRIEDDEKAPSIPEVTPLQSQKVLMKVGGVERPFFLNRKVRETGNKLPFAKAPSFFKESLQPLFAQRLPEATTKPFTPYQVALLESSKREIMQQLLADLEVYIDENKKLISTVSLDKTQFKKKKPQKGRTQESSQKEGEKSESNGNDDNEDDEGDDDGGDDKSDYSMSDRDE